VIVSNINDSKACYSLVIKSNPSAEEAQLEKIREVQRRKRKEKLYSSQSAVKSRYTLP
jgi:hypothetical protein